MGTFVSVVAHNGFAAAARDLGLSPSAVSKQIGRLEDRLGVRLLNRTTRTVRLTAEGEAYFRRATAILDEIAAAEAEVTQMNAAPRGRLRVNASIAFGRNQVVPLLPEFLKRYPDLELELTISDMLVDIVAEGVDVAIRVAELQDSSLVARKLAVDKRVFCAAPGYLAANGTPQTPDDLRLHNCLTYNLPGDAHDWVVQEEGKPRTIRLRGRFETNSSIALHQAAVAGLGIARLATFLVGPDIRAGRLVQVLPHVVTTEAPIYAVYPHRRHLSPKVRAFVNYMVEQFTPVPPWDR